MRYFKRDHLPFAKGDKIVLTEEGFERLGPVFKLSRSDTFEVEGLVWSKEYSPQYGYRVDVTESTRSHYPTAIWEMYVVSANPKMNEPDFDLDEIHAAQELIDGN